MELSQEQQAAVDVIKSNQLCLFTGPPGSGKTTTLSHWLRSDRREIPTVYLAPTGKAAQRMSEAFAEVSLTADAQTIHSALHPLRGGHDGGGWQFRYGKYKSLPVSRIVVDESSMIDASLMRSLLDATPSQAQLVLTGDPNQLPPVGSGKPFLDLLRSGVVPHAQLTTVHRFAGRGAHVCQQIMRGDPPTFSPSLNLDLEAGPYGPENIRHIECSDPDRAVQKMLVCCDRMVGRGFDAFFDVQVICFTNRTRENLNKALQEHLNPTGLRVPDFPYRVGDKVMCLKNQWCNLTELGPKGPSYRSDGRLRYVANGETGIISYLDAEMCLVKFPRSNGHVRYARDAAKSQLTLAYAITCHKSQGGGWPVVIYMIDKSIKCDRSLVYTAISRFGQICLTIGQRAAINRQVRDTSVRHRLTYLQQRLKEEIPPSTRYMEIDNVSVIESEGQSRRVVFNDRPEDEPEWIPMVCLGEGSVNTVGETGVLVAESWIAIRKLGFAETDSDEHGGFSRL